MCEYKIIDYDNMVQPRIIFSFELQNLFQMPEYFAQKSTDFSKNIFLEHDTLFMRYDMVYINFSYAHMFSKFYLSTLIK